MGKRIYYFGDFCLDPLAQELTRNGEPVTLSASALQCLVYLVEHRERVVGKDELVSAVWKRVDVSDNLLAQTIVRLRRGLGDASADQRCIRTIPRVGYRWMLETAVAEPPDDAAEAAPAQAQVELAAGPARRVRPSPWLRAAIGIAALLVLAVALVWWRRSVHERPPVSFKHGTAIVLPVEVHAPEEWKWLRLGLMDLVSNGLRDARVPVESSRTVLELLDQGDSHDNARFASFALVVRPRVTLVGQVWHVHLDATTRDGHTWQADTSSDDVLSATRQASYQLLPQLGYLATSPRAVSGEPGEQYLLRIYAASYAGTVDAERDLIEKAPPDVRALPEFAFIQATFVCDQDDYARCKQALAELLQRLPADTQPVLRGKTLVEQEYIYARERDYAGGRAAMSEAIRLFQQKKSIANLATAYQARGYLAYLDGKFDQSESDFGLARVNYALAGDTVAALGIDAELAMLAMRRGQFAQALPVLQRAYETYQRMGMRQFLEPPLQNIVTAQKMLLQYHDELATTDRYWPFERTHLEFTDSIERHLMMYMRAQALADNGRTAEASRLLEQTLADIARDAKGEPGLQACVEALLAKFALQRGDVQAAQQWIATAMAGQKFEKDNDRRDYAYAWLTDVMVAQRAGKSDELKRVVAAMQAWVAGAPDHDEWIAILLLRAQAAAAWSEGRHEQALDQLKLAMNKADAFGVPELVVDVGQAYAQALLAAGKLQEAASVSGKLSPWSQSDWRAAWTQACVYRALGQATYAETYRSKAHELAGDRVLPADASVSVY